MLFTLDHVNNGSRIHTEITIHILFGGTNTLCVKINRDCNNIKLFQHDKIRLFRYSIGKLLSQLRYFSFSAFGEAMMPRFGTSKRHNLQHGANYLAKN